MSGDIQVSTEGDEQALAIVRALQSPEFLVPTFHQIGTILTSELKKYPPPPPNSSYRRTGTLGRRWTFQVRRNLYGVKVIAGNNTSYAPDVQDPDQQAPVHQGRWQTTEDVLDDKSEEIVGEVQGAVEAKVRELGG